MIEECLTFTAPAATYDPVRTAEHMVRYKSVEQLCRGKRVLDVSCGEGYGSWLLARWGAAEVVGIDISARAISVAQNLFAAPNIQYLTGDACDLTEALGNVGAFDLVIAFEAIMAVADVPALLGGMRKYCADQGTLVLSCPNGHIDLGANPYHRRLYTFDEFCDATTQVLGPASGWLIGGPTYGHLLFPADALRAEDKDSREAMLVGPADVVASSVIPARTDIAPDASSCLFYVGYWGQKIGAGAVLSPQSVPAANEASRTITQLKLENARLNRSQAGMELIIAEITARDQEKTEDSKSRQAELASLEVRANESVAAAEMYRAANSNLERQLAELRVFAGNSAAVAETHRVANSNLEKQLAELRRRVIVHARVEQEIAAEANRAEMLRVANSHLERQLAELEVLATNSAAIAEMHRAANSNLERQLAELRRRAIVHARVEQEIAAEAKITLDKLDRCQAELVSAQHELLRWSMIERSRFYRAMRYYVRIYTVPVIGPMLRRLRRAVGIMTRLGRRR